MLLNAVRAHMGEVGIQTGAGIAQSMRVVRSILDGDQQQYDASAQSAIEPLARMVIDVRERITKLDKEIISWHDRSDMSTLLETIPGVGVITASAIAAMVTDPGAFESARHCAAWMGLVLDKTPPAARLALVEQQKVAITIYESCSYLARQQFRGFSARGR